MNPFTPLKTYQGLSISELAILANDRDIFIWGCGHLGRIMKRCFDKNRLNVKSFCDSNAKLHTRYVDNIRVMNPEEVFNSVKQKQALIIIASAKYRHEIEEICINAGLVKNEDFLSYTRISRPEAVVDVSGKCNLRCPSCPQGNIETLRPSGCMAASVYRRVLNKLLMELPDLMNIELSAWGEPFMNPELAEIIEMTELSVPCTVHTNLQLSDQLEDVIRAQPSQIMISAGGYEESYEANHADSSWLTFLDNIHFLRALADKYRPKTEFAVLYHLYRNNQQQDLDNMRNLCSKLNFKFSTTWAYLNPYDKVLDYCEGQNIGVKAGKVLEILPWDLDLCLELSRSDAHLPCLCQRIFPVINWDLSVSLCHIYYHPLIAENFLDTPLSELLKLRHNQLQCRSCQKHGLHRLDIDILLRRHSAISILLSDKRGEKAIC